MQSAETWAELITHAERLRATLKSTTDTVTVADSPAIPDDTSSLEGNTENPEQQMEWFTPNPRRQPPRPQSPPPTAAQRPPCSETMPLVINESLCELPFSQSDLNRVTSADCRSFGRLWVGVCSCDGFRFQHEMLRQGFGYKRTFCWCRFHFGER